MSTPEWRKLGFLTPDAYECQQDVWALSARLRHQLADVLAGLSEQSAEPSWAASLSEAAQRARQLAEQLAEEAGADARLRVDEDDVVRETVAALDEVIASGHVPSLVATGYGVLGELAVLPIRLLEDVAGPHAALLCGRITGSETHVILGRLFGILHVEKPVLTALRKLLRHLDGQLFGVYQSWRQTLHTLGVDGELLAEEGAATVRRVHETLGIPIGAADLAAFR